MEARSHLDPGKMNPAFLQRLLTEDGKSKVVCQVNKSCIDYVNLQTSAMGEVFSKFPEVLLIIRSHNTHQRALYTFLADGPRIGAPYEVTRIVHIAVPTNETPQGLAGMFHVMKELNPCWTSIRVFLVDPDFTEVGAIHEAFPSVEVVPSACHVYTHVQQRIHELSLPEKAESILLNALKNTMCSATERNLQNLSSILQRFVDPGVLSHIKQGWLLTDRIWALHRWRTWEESSCYFKRVKSLSHGLNTIFNMSPFVQNSINAVVTFIIEQTAGKSLPEPRNCSPEELALIKCKGEASKKTKMEAQMEPEDAALLCESLHNICNPAAFGLCQNELEVTHKSLDLVGTNGDKVCVQILENPSEVSYGKFKTCTCGFYRSTELPCRHILSVLNANEEVLQPDMIHTLWQKQNNEPEATLPVQPDTLEIIKGQENDGSDNHLLVNALTGQISALLAECSDEIFERRYNTLRELADAWIGPYEQVKL